LVGDAVDLKPGMFEIEEKDTDTATAIHAQASVPIRAIRG
jgi:hypothetical protein